ncbi:MAG TPA: cupin-like domain-containing protein [Luteimonas sp.]|nr:cupin-like domain-containing protein [Luteimonas sp.]
MPRPIAEIQAAGHPVALADLVGEDRPLVIRGLCADWPVVAAARQSDTVFANALAAFDGGTPVDTLLLPPEAEGVIGYDDDFGAFNYRHYRVTVTQALHRLASASRAPDPPGIALQSASIPACLPGFVETHRMPLLDPAIAPRLWIGNRVTTPVHFDEYHNIAVVAAGRRRFTLFPIEQVGNLYIGPLDFAPTGAAIGVARLDRPDDPRHPRLREALAHALQAELDPGDALYLPPLWWHHVESLHRINALVNYWWYPSSRDDRGARTGLASLMHAVLALRGLPPAQRAAWRTVFDHYVFGDADPVAHLPEGRRGMLGALTPEAAAALAERIRKYL